MTFEHFLIQALGLLDKLRQRGVIVYYRAGSGSSIGTESTSFIAKAEIDGFPSIDLELNSESYIESYDEALMTLNRAADFVELRDATFARMKDLLSALSVQELMTLQSDAGRQFVVDVIRQKSAG